MILLVNLVLLLEWYVTYSVVLCDEVLHILLQVLAGVLNQLVELGDDLTLLVQVGMLLAACTGIQLVACIEELVACAEEFLPELVALLTRHVADVFPFSLHLNQFVTGLLPLGAVSHLGIVTGLCLSEAASRYINRTLKNVILVTAVAAAIATAMAEILGGAIALQMLFHIPIKVGSMLILVVVLFCEFTNAYKRIEKLIMLFVSLIGFCFLIEICMVKIDWGAAATGWVKPVFPSHAMPVIMSVLGAVVMPHNLFLHSEIIQSRKWNLKEEAVIQRQLKFEFKDTLFSMIIGWAINSAMILMAAATFYQRGENQVDDLTTAGNMLTPLLGNEATVIFAIALLLAGLSSSITAGMAGGTIFSGIFNKPYDIATKETRQGVLITMIPAALIILLIRSPFQGLIYSQMLLAVQLPITIFTQIYLTSSKKVMGKYANSTGLKMVLWAIAIVVTALNIGLFVMGF